VSGPPARRRGDRAESAGHRGDVPHTALDVGDLVLVAQVEEDLGLPRVEAVAGVHLDRHDIVLPVDVEQLVTVVRPERRGASVGGDLPLAVLDVREGAYEHFRAIRLEGLVRDPP
jgi:hypothetical protein